MASLAILTPADLPMTAADIRYHCRIDETAEDALLEYYLAAAAREAEEIMGRPVGATVYQLRLHRFPAAGPILLPRPRAVTIESLSYLDQSGATNTVAAESRQADLHGEPAQILPAVGSAWPATQAGALNAVTITYTAGSAAVDPLILQAIRLAVGDWYEHREDTLERTVSRLPNGFERLLRPLRFRSRELARFLAEH